MEVVRLLIRQRRVARSRNSLSPPVVRLRHPDRSRRRCFTTRQKRYTRLMRFTEFDKARRFVVPEERELPRSHRVRSATCASATTQVQESRTSDGDTVTVRSPTPGYRSPLADRHHLRRRAAVGADGQHLAGAADDRGTRAVTAGLALRERGVPGHARHHPDRRRRPAAARTRCALPRRARVAC